MLPFDYCSVVYIKWAGVKDKESINGGGGQQSQGISDETERPTIASLHLSHVSPEDWEDYKFSVLCQTSVSLLTEISLWLLHVREEIINKSMIIQQLVLIMIKPIRPRLELEIQLWKVLWPINIIFIVCDTPMKNN